MTGIRPREIVSKRARVELRKYLERQTLKEIHEAFEAADIARPRGVPQGIREGVRSAYVNAYYDSLDFTSWDDARRLLDVFANVIAELEQLMTNRQLEEDTFFRFQHSVRSLRQAIGADGFYYEQGRVARRGAAGLPVIEKAASTFDVPELQRQIARLHSAIDDDPGLAVGTAKELVETTCKTVLHVRGVVFSDNADIGELVNHVPSRAAAEKLLAWNQIAR